VEPKRFFGAHFTQPVGLGCHETGLQPFRLTVSQAIPIFRRDSYLLRYDARFTLGDQRAALPEIRNAASTTLAHALAGAATPGPNQVARGLEVSIPGQGGGFTHHMGEQEQFGGYG